MASESSYYWKYTIYYKRLGNVLTWRINKTDKEVINDFIEDLFSDKGSEIEKFEIIEILNSKILKDI